MSQPKHDDANTQQPIMFALLKTKFFRQPIEMKNA